MPFMENLHQCVVTIPQRALGTISGEMQNLSDNTLHHHAL